MDYKQLEQEFFKAALKAITATGTAYKSLSWFRKNKSSTEK